MYPKLRQRRLRLVSHVQNGKDGCIPKYINYGYHQPLSLRYKDACTTHMKSVDIDTDGSWALHVVRSLVYSARRHTQITLSCPMFSSATPRFPYLFYQSLSMWFSLCLSLRLFSGTGAYTILLSTLPSSILLTCPYPRAYHMTRQSHLRMRSHSFHRMATRQLQRVNMATPTASAYHRINVCL